MEKELDKVEYQLYEKVKSPNDYDIAGYDSKGQAIRSPKIGSSMSKEQIYDYREMLEKKKEKIENTIVRLKEHIKNAECELESIPEPLRDMLKMKYLDELSYSAIALKYFMSKETCRRYINRELSKRYD